MEVRNEMNSKDLAIAGVIAVVLSLVVVQVFAAPQYFGWGSAMMGNRNGHMNQSNGCGVMNAQGMMGAMNGQQANHQQYEQHMASNGGQMMNGQYHNRQ